MTDTEYLVEHSGVGQTVALVPRRLGRTSDCKTVGSTHTPRTASRRITVCLSSSILLRPELFLTHRVQMPFQLRALSPTRHGTVSQLGGHEEDGQQEHQLLPPSQALPTYAAHVTVFMETTSASFSGVHGLKGNMFRPEINVNSTRCW